MQYIIFMYHKGLKATYWQAYQKRHSIDCECGNKMDRRAQNCRFCYRKNKKGTIIINRKRIREFELMFEKAQLAIKSIQRKKVKNLFG